MSVFLLTTTRFKPRQPLRILNSSARQRVIEFGRMINNQERGHGVVSSERSYLFDLMRVDVFWVWQGAFYGIEQHAGPTDIQSNPFDRGFRPSQSYSIASHAGRQIPLVWARPCYRRCPKPQTDVARFEFSGPAHAAFSESLQRSGSVQL